MCRGQDDVSCNERSAAAVPGRYVLQRDYVGVGILDRIHPTNDVMCRRRRRPGMRHHLLIIRTTAGHDYRRQRRDGYHQSNEWQCRPSEGGLSAAFGRFGNDDRGGGEAIFAGRRSSRWGIAITIDSRVDRRHLFRRGVYGVILLRFWFFWETSFLARVVELQQLQWMILDLCAQRITMMSILL